MFDTILKLWTAKAVIGAAMDVVKPKPRAVVQVDEARMRATRPSPGRGIRSGYFNSPTGQAPSRVEIGFNRKSPVSVEDVLSVTYVDPRGLRIFSGGSFMAIEPNIKRELWRSLSGQWVLDSPDVGAFDDIVTLVPDKDGKPVPLSESAEGWALARNSERMILAPVYLPFNTSARRFLRAVSPQVAIAYAGSGGMYAVLADVGEGERLRGANVPNAPEPPQRKPEDFPPLVEKPQFVDWPKE